MIELERTYLAKFLPAGISDCEKKKMVDIYLPADSDHPKLRVRKQGEKYVITKKNPVVEGDATKQKEENIGLTEKEFGEFNQLIGKRVEKTRYYYPVGKLMAEIDVFEGNLRGLVLVDFEFDNQADFDNFVSPEFCGEFVGQEDFVAGGLLAGKKYEDIEENLKKFGYEKIDE